ncbi:sulfatase [Tautonia plasticadhaerens]|uniref:Choline-sulfatase n=1 Tax=Tautonia plasticadhaerens TaxID=2527974 RepID=A0A518H9W8_9BACT|nr:sulfatase-like hydrolase/transferase [Tautonia plasticadhaerens]QDV37648.1 Choline-sulfatase [Tautonia plasticadhaerens]
MVFRSGSTAPEPPETTLQATEGGSPSVGVSPAMILLLATWVGLVAGWLDLGLMVVERRLIRGEFYRLGEHFVWLIPLGVAVLMLVPGTVLALIAGLRRGGVRPGMALGLLAFVGFLDICARLPLSVWASLVLSAGVAVQSARLAGARRRATLGLVRRTTPWLVGVLLAVMLAKIGGRAWSEHRATAALPPPPEDARNVLLIVWDTVRAGNLSLYGYGRPTTPNLERFAGRGVRFDLAFATSSWTLPSHASLFTGRWPYELGVGWTTPLRPGVPTLAEYLGSRGYDTAGFVANLDYCSRETGLDRGFAHYEDYPIGLYETFTRYVGLGHRTDLLGWACILERLAEGASGRPLELKPRSREHAKRGAEVDREFLDWLSWQQGRRRPFFAFLNYNDAHTPYEPPESSAPGFGLRPVTCRDRLTLRHWAGLEKAKLARNDVRMASDAYDDCISYLDRRLGVLLDELGRRGVLDDTLVIVASDHGEHLGDHLLFFHGCSLYRQVVQVPLVIVDPQGQAAGRVVAEPVSLRDVPATIVDVLGLNLEAPFPGRSLARLWGEDSGGARPSAEPLLMETDKPIVLMNQGREPAAKGPMKSLVAGGMHYIRSGDGSEELYSLRSDPQERVNLSGAPAAGGILQQFRAGLVTMIRKK